MTPTAPPSPVKAIPPAARMPAARRGSRVLPCRRAAGHTFARASKHRRTARDYVRLPSSHEAIVTWIMTGTLMTRHHAQPAPATTND